MNQRAGRQATAMEVVIDGLAKVHAAAEQPQRQLNQRLPAKGLFAKVEMPLVVK